VWISSVQSSKIWTGLSCEMSGTKFELMKVPLLRIINGLKRELVFWVVKSLDISFIGNYALTC